MDNPLRDAWLAASEHLRIEHGHPSWDDLPFPPGCPLCGPVRAEDDPRRRYAWAIPTEEAVRALAEFARGRGLIEIGAGLGYWAKLLGAAGADVAAYDIEPQGHGTFFAGNASPHFPVQTGGPEMAARAGRRVLFLCWPPMGSSMAAHALATYPGSRFAYAGEDRGGCTADGEFHHLLERDWRVTDRIELPRWRGAEDNLTFWKRVRTRRS